MKNIITSLVLIFFAISVDAQCDPTSGTDDQVACEEFTWIDDTGYCKEWRLNCDIAAEMWYDFEILVHKKKKKKVLKVT